MLSIGLDVHWRTSTFCILDENGKEIKTQTVRGAWSKVLAVSRKIEEPFAIGYEASCGYGALHDQLGKIARRVVVAHPGQLRLIFRSKRKNDRVDAKKLAYLLFVDQLPTVHVPSVDVRAWRRMIEFRNQRIGQRGRGKTGRRALRRTHGIESPRGKGRWTRAGVAWVADVAFPTTGTTRERDIGLENLKHVTVQVRRVERELNAIGRRHPGVQVLRTCRAWARGRPRR